LQTKTRRLVQKAEHKPSRWYMEIA